MLAAADTSRATSSPPPMTFVLTDAQRTARDGFRQFVAESILPHASRFDREERLPETLLREMAERRYFGLTIPAAYGGLGADMTTCGLLHEEVGRGCSSVRSVLTAHGMTAAAILRWGTSDQRMRWLPAMAKGETIGAFALTEPLAGSDAQAVTTTASALAAGFQIDGYKQWITGGQIAGLFLVIGRCDGQPAAFLVPRDSSGLTIVPVPGMLGLRAAMLAELTLSGALLAADALVGRIGFGISHVAFTALDYARFTVAWGCLGLAQACLDASMHHAAERRQFGAALQDHQLIRRMLTDMITNVRAARLLCGHAAALRDAGDSGTVIETLVAKYFASISAHRAADDCVQIHGATGCSAASPVQRYLRDARIMEIIEGSTQMQQLTIAKYLCQA
jgi:glutaryl-CoA dehydrogenase (non-decarboxylating)